MTRHTAVYGITVLVAIASAAMWVKPTTALAAGQAISTIQPTEGVNMSISAQAKQAQAVTHPYVGMWVTADGYIRHELLPNGRYDEARGKKASAYQGRYRVTGNHIDYVDDTGFTADGEFRDGILYHAGMVLYREQS